MVQFHMKQESVVHIFCAHVVTPLKRNKNHQRKNVVYFLFIHNSMMSNNNNSNIMIILALYVLCVCCNTPLMTLIIYEYPLFFRGFIAMSQFCAYTLVKYFSHNKCMECAKNLLVFNCR